MSNDDGTRSDDARSQVGGSRLQVHERASLTSEESMGETDGEHNEDGTDSTKNEALPIDSGHPR